MIRSLKTKLAKLFTSSKTLDLALLEQLENTLLTADVGLATTTSIMDDLKLQLKKQKINDLTQCKQLLQQQLIARLQPVAKPLDPSAAKPFVILMVGVNGAGKTTTIGKIAKQLTTQGKKVLLAAGDTFRAAAVEQLKIWGERNNVPVIAQATGADSAAVLFDAVQAAIARNIDIVLADSAGRLHTQDNLMAELTKIIRVIGKIDGHMPHETMLIIDASQGQNALTQAKRFKELVNISSISLTKLDGSAKGGIVFAIADTLRLPIRFIGTGEKITDLQPFNANLFVEHLLND